MCHKNGPVDNSWLVGDADGGWGLHWAGSRKPLRHAERCGDRSCKEAGLAPQDGLALDEARRCSRRMVARSKMRFSDVVAATLLITPLRWTVCAGCDHYKPWKELTPMKLLSWVALAIGLIDSPASQCAQKQPARSPPRRERLQMDSLHQSWLSGLQSPTQEVVRDSAHWASEWLRVASNTSLRIPRSRRWTSPATWWW